jgi:hypothetical protein
VAIVLFSGLMFAVVAGSLVLLCCGAEDFEARGVLL